MRGLLFTVALVVLLSGCLQVSTTSESGSTGDDSSFSETCFNGQCSTCVDGVCTGPLEEFRQEAAKQHEDVEIREAHDLLQGLSPTSWSFWVDANATGHIELRAVDLATGQAAVVPTVCVAWEHRTPSSSGQGSTGNCSSGTSIFVSGGTLTESTVLSWQSLDRGHYTFTASAPPQPNQLLVDIVVDNP